MERRNLLLTLKLKLSSSAQLVEDIAQCVASTTSVSQVEDFNFVPPKSAFISLFLDALNFQLMVSKTRTGFYPPTQRLLLCGGSTRLLLMNNASAPRSNQLPAFDALPALIRGDKRIHTTFNQTVAATGDFPAYPNLQNIPTRSGHRAALLTSPRAACFAALPQIGFACLHTSRLTSTW